MPVSPRLIVLLLIGLLAVGCDRQKAETPQAQAANSASPASTGKGVDRSHKGEAAPIAMFKNPDGGDVSIAKFKGVPVLVNLWASWCAPCVKELPTLDRLAQSHRIDGALGVVAVSEDSGPINSVKAFLAAHKIGDLGAYHDPDMKLTDALGVQIMPTTVLYDAAGKEVWRYTGDLDWTGAEATKLLSEISPAAAR